jgi:trans-2,3-dihydro-3-hydroxyanthranilate isomerase
VSTLPPQESLPFVIVDVFADRPFAGNPLAVVTDGEALSTAQMQHIAREFNLSETAFPLRPTPEQKAQGADYHLRIFTPAVELPFAGHPSVGSAWWLARSAVIATGNVMQLCGEGLLPIHVDSDGATLTGGAARVSEPVDPTDALAAVGLDSADLAGAEVRVASTGLAYAVLLVHDDALASCSPDSATLQRAFSYPSEATGVYVVAWDKLAKRARARMFAGDIGSVEDPATGSAALALGAFLAATGELANGTHEVLVEQGIEMGRPSQLLVRSKVSDGWPQRITVSGKAVLVSQGRISVPGLLRPA